MKQEVPPHIIYDEIIVVNNESSVITRLYSDGLLEIGRSVDKLRKVVFFNDPVKNIPWVPERKMFIEIMTESIASNEYDLDGDVVCLESFVSDLRRLLNEDKPSIRQIE